VGVRYADFDDPASLPASGLPIRPVQINYPKNTP